MAYILNIETSTKNCSVSLAFEGKIIALKEENRGSYSHAEQLHTFITEVCSKAKVPLSDLDAIAVSKGPGSYTGLRIGVSAAKGLCFALEKPLLAIDTLTSLAHASEGENAEVIIPMLDARRMEVYAAVYTNDYSQIREIKAEVITETSYAHYLEKGRVIFIGDAVSKCKPVINHPNAVFIENTFPSAAQMSTLSYIKYKKNDIEDVAYFEPFYLKDFVVIPEKKKKSIF